MISKHMRMALWANVRAIGKWRYVFVFGMMSFSPTCTILVFLQDTYSGGPLVWPGVLATVAIYIIFGGSLFECISWVLNERACPNYEESKLETF